MVTPSKYTGTRGAGRPHIFVEVRDRVEEDNAIDTSKHPGTDRAPPPSNVYGKLLDLRVLAIDSDGDVSPFWVESWTWAA